MKWPILKLTVLERVIVCLSLALLFGFIDFSFASIGYLCALAALLFFLALCTWRRIAAVTTALLGVVCLVTVLTQWLAVDPMRIRISGRYFEAAPLPEVLQHLAAQRSTFPHWTFMIHDEALANKRVTLDIPNSATLKEALKLISTTQGCEINYNWFRGCGNAPSPTFAQFHISKPGAGKPSWINAVVYISAEGILRQSNRVDSASNL